ncbi:hypothetical protein, partial [Streptomyces sp. NPDC005167]
MTLMPERIEQLSAINLRWAPTVLNGDAQMSVSWDGVPLPAGSLPRRIGEHKMGRSRTIPPRIFSRAS